MTAVTVTPVAYVGAARPPVWEPLTDRFQKALEEAVGEERLRQLPEKHLQGSGDNVDVLPLAVVQIQLLFWENMRRNGTTGFNETITRH